MVANRLPDNLSAILSLFRVFIALTLVQKVGKSGMAVLYVYRRFICCNDREKMDAVGYEKVGGGRLGVLARSDWRVRSVRA